MTQSTESKPRVRGIYVGTAGRIHVTLERDGKQSRRSYPEFGVGQPGRETAAFARFLAACGVNEVVYLYRNLVALPRDYEGPLLSMLKYKPKARRRPTAPWDCVLVDY